MSPSRHLDSNQKGGRVKSGRSGAPKPDKLGLSCKTNKRSDAGTGDLGVLPIYEALLMKINLGWCVATQVDGQVFAETVAQFWTSSIGPYH